MPASLRIRVRGTATACMLLTAAFMLTACGGVPAGTGGGGTASSPGGGGGEAGPFTLTGRTFDIPLGAAGEFTLSASGLPARTGVAVEVFSQVPSDSPSSGTLMLTQANAQVVGGSAQTVRVTAYIGSGNSPNPCEEGENIGTFVLSVSAGVVSVQTGSLSLTPIALSYARSGTFTLCLEASGDDAATLGISALALQFGSGPAPTPEPTPEPEPDPEPEPVDDPATTILFTQFTNTGDPLLFTASTPDGENLEYFAEKGDDGYPTKILAMKYQSADDIDADEATWIHFDDGARPNRFVGADGTILDMEWTSDTEIMLTGITGDGAIQINTVIDLNEPVEETAKMIAASAVSSRLGIPLQLEGIDITHQVGPGMCLESDVVKRDPDGCKTSIGNGEMSVEVVRCGAGVPDAWVYVSYDSPYASLHATHPAIYSGAPGVYDVTLPMPEGAIEPEEAQRICRNAVSKLGEACLAAPALDGAAGLALCAKLSAAIDVAAFGPTGEAAPIMAACTVGLQAYLFMCKAIGTGPLDAPPGTPGIGDFVCDHIKSVVSLLPDPEPQSMEIAAYATIPGKGKKTSGPQIVSSLGPFPTLRVDFGGDPSIDSFATDPPDPGPGQGYTAEVLISCANLSTVTIAVSGSDDYSNSVTIDVTGDQYKATLWVPGGGEGVRDTIGVLVQPPLTAGLDAKSLSKTIVVVF